MDMRRTGVLLNRLMRAYRGELEAISEYSYYSIVTEPTDPELSDLFERIAEDEMRHFRMLGELIRDLGGNPVIRLCINVEPLYPAGCGKGGFSVRGDLLGRLADGEDAARKDYLAIAELSGDNEISGMLRRIASDEERHAALLRGERCTP